MWRGENTGRGGLFLAVLGAYHARMRRRTFLGGAAALLAQPPEKIIDTHTHFYDPARPQGVPWPPKDDAVLYRTTLPPRYVAMAAPLGIVGTVVVEASAWVEDNYWILDLAEENPIIVGLVGNLPAGRAEFREHFERLRKRRLFLGIRLNAQAVARGLAEPAVFSDIERLAGANLELDVVGGPAMLADVVRLADRLPGLRIVIDHLPFDWPADPAARDAARAALRELGKRPQVYAKVSNVLRRKAPTSAGFYRAALDDVWDAFGQDRVIYGSNWPVSDLVAPMRRCSTWSASISPGRAGKPPRNTSSRTQKRRTGG